MKYEQSLYTFTYTTLILIENVASYWLVSINPEVVDRNLKIKEQQNSAVCGYMFSYFFFGMIVGSFIWPSVSKVLSKRNCIILGFLLQALTNFMTGLTTNLMLIYFWRVLFGAAHNMNTIGKSFVFDFSEPENRQMLFNTKSCACLAAACFGPLIGYYLYIYCNKDYYLSFAYISAIYGVGILLFFITFYIYYDNVSVEDKVKKADDEEAVGLVESKDKQKDSLKSQKSIWEVLGIIYSKPLVRDAVLAYFIVNGDYTVRLFITIFYMEAPWKDQGLGISTEAVSIINMLIFFPSLVLLLTSPSFIPKKFSVFGFTKFVMWMSLIWTFLMPILRDVFPNNQHLYFYVICIVFSMSSFFNPNLFSPFLNLYMNDQMDRDSRVAFNSITFISFSVSAVLMVAFISPFFSISLYDPFFVKFVPYNKYLCFVIMDLLLASGLYILRNHK